MKTALIDLPHLIDNFLLNGGEIEQLQYGNAVKEDDGENWREVNKKTYLIRQDKGESQ